MRNLIISCCLVLFQFVFGNVGQVLFTENNGQLCDQFFFSRNDIKFYSQINQTNIYFKKNGFSYQFNKVLKWKDVQNQAEKLHSLEVYKAPDIIEVKRIDLNWVGSNLNTIIEANDSTSGYNNYYLQHCPEGVLRVKSFNKILYKNLYNNIDLVFYSQDGNLKYDYVVKPNSNYKSIKLNIVGHEGVYVNSKGELVIKLNNAEIVEAPPLVKQDNKEFKANWVVDQNVVSFEIYGVDETKTFIIDPLIRAWGTYCGGANYDRGLTTSLDNFANVFMGGITYSPLLIATSGAHQVLLNANKEGFLQKYNSLGVRQWGTYYGGNGDESVIDCCTDKYNNVYIAGVTNSSVAISTPGTHQSNYNGLDDAFVVKFNSSGVRIWGTYYGGYRKDEGYTCIVDQNLNVYLGGNTLTDTVLPVIATSGAHQASFASILSFFEDGFVAKFDSTGSRLWGTYYGGDGSDFVRSCAITKAGDVIIIGTTTSSVTTNISSMGSYQSNSGGFYDGFVGKFNSNGVWQWGTYYGGNDNENLLDCALDKNDNIYACGQTSTSTNTVIASNGSHQSSYGGNNDGYLVKFNNSGNRIWGTYYGGGGNDYGLTCTVDSFSNVILGGQTFGGAGGDTISSPGSYQPIYGGGFTDSYFAKFNSLGVRQWGSYYGGSGEEDIWSCSTNGRDIYISGETTSSNSLSIATPSSSQSFFGGVSDGYLAQFYDCSAFSITINSTANILCAGQTATIVASGTSTYSWSTGNTTNSIVVSPTVTTSYTVTGGNFCGTDFSVFTQSVSVCTGIEENLSEIITVFPNPFINEFKILFKRNLEADLSVYNIHGQKLVEKKMNGIENIICMNSYPDGVYYVRLNGMDSIYTFKIIKQ